MNDWPQRNELMKNGKLKTYLALKTNFGLEKYLTILNNFHYKRSICRLRISSHRLQIETGRYRNVPRDERICQKCSENEIEDEVHFLIKCSENKVAREQLFLQISQKCKKFTSLSNENKLFWMLNCEDQSILTSVGKFIYDHMP